jgi:hypothetical protein
MPVDNRCSDQPGCKIGSKQRCLRQRKSCASYTNAKVCEDMGCEPKYGQLGPGQKSGLGPFEKCQGVSQKAMPACTTRPESNGKFAGCDGSNEWGDCVGPHWMTWCIDNK